MKPEERRAIAAVPAYERSTATKLSDVYGRYSRAKEKAFEHCRDLCYKYRGHNLKIITASKWMFTAGFEFENLETGEIMFMYITKSYNTAVSYPAH